LADLPKNVTVKLQRRENGKSKKRKDHEKGRVRAKPLLQKRKKADNPILKRSLREKREKKNEKEHPIPQESGPELQKKK